MKKKMITFGGVIAAVLFALLAVHHFYTREVDTSKEPDTSKKEPAEYLHITATAYNNRQNDDDGISLVLYLYSIRDQTMSEIARFPIDPDYPVAFADLHDNKVYFSESNPGEDFDNLRTPKVREVTFIRPKTLYLMDLDFGNYQPIYHTDQFEIRLTRQLDANRILMTWDPFMGASKPRTLRMLYLDTQKVEDFDVPGIKEVKSFYPRDNAEGIFILGRDLNNTYGLFYYDLVTKQVSNLFEKYPLPKNHRSLVDFVYSMNLNPRHASGGVLRRRRIAIEKKAIFPYWINCYGADCRWDFLFFH